MIRLTQLDRQEARRLISEIKGGTLSPAEQHVLRAVMSDSDEIWSAYYDDELLAVWGLIPPTLMSSRAYLWMQHSQSVRNHEFVFIRHSQLIVERMLAEYDTIVGQTRASDTRAIRWLRWLGAEFGRVEGTLVPFTIRKHEWPIRLQSGQWR